MFYRFYVISGAGSRSIPVEFDCPTDAGAMMHAGELVGVNRSVEVWQRTRFVGEIGQFFSRWSSGEGAGPGARVHSSHPA